MNHFNDFILNELLWFLQYFRRFFCFSRISWFGLGAFVSSRLFESFNCFRFQSNKWLWFVLRFFKNFKKLWTIIYGPKFMVIIYDSYSILKIVTVFRVTDDPICSLIFNDWTCLLYIIRMITVMDYWWFVRSEEKSILPALWLVIYALLILYCIFYAA